MEISYEARPSLAPFSDCHLGIELGSTRIKAVLTDTQGQILATGSCAWQNSLVNGMWSYELQQVHFGLQAAYTQLKQNVQSQYGSPITTLRAMGISAMMHGYLAFDGKGCQLVPFRTWRNTTTGTAAARLSQLFGYNIPQRWSVAHLYQAMLNGEDHVKELSHITTLAGYVHWQLTDQKVLGVGDASGMFPIDLQTKDWDATMLGQFDTLHREPWQLKKLLPQVLVAGQGAGRLTAQGAAILDPSGSLTPGILCCAPEGDAGTGMVATNSVAVRTGNVSAGTSVFAMLVLERPLSQMRKEIDLVTTPDCRLVAMVHCNNGSTDIDAWTHLFGEAAQLLLQGLEHDNKASHNLNIVQDYLFSTLYNAALAGDADCGSLLHYGYVAGEDMVELLEGCPLFVRRPNSQFTLANFMRSQLYSSLCALRLGLNILVRDEGVQVDEIRGHGGFFKAKTVGQRIMAAATNTPVTVLENAGEGGAWGMALLAAYAAECATAVTAAPIGLSDFLKPFFSSAMEQAMPPDPKEVAGFNSYFARFMQCLPVERSALQNLPNVATETANL